MKELFTKTTTENKNNKLQQSSYQINKSSIYSAIYLFSTTIKRDASENRNLTEIQYIRQVKLNFLGEFSELYVYQMLCVKFSMQGNFDKLLIKKISRVYDELLVGCDHDGNIKKIINHQKIIVRWDTIKVEILNDYQGTVMQNYLRTIDETLNDEKLLINFLKSKKMFGLFFNGLWKLNLENDKNGMKNSKVTIKSDNNLSDIYMYENNRLIEANILLDKINYNCFRIGFETHI